MTPGRDLSVHELVALLAPVLGEEKAREAVTSAARTTRSTKAEAVLKELATQPGVVGAAARFAQARLPKAERPEPAPSSPRLPVGAPHPAARGPAPTVDAEQIAALLAPTLGQEKSAEIVAAALEAMGAPSKSIDLPRALAVLEHVATVPGLVGVAARFAKARLILLFKR